jgi:cation transport protein ChaC
MTAGHEEEGNHITMSQQHRPVLLTRELLLSGALQDLLAAMACYSEVLPAGEFAASLEEAQEQARALDEVWVFGYGSLLWNPAFHFLEQQPGRLVGFHRRLCLWTPAGRGTDEVPGLVLGLDSGGSCQGGAFLLESTQAAVELEVLWRREMITGAYRPAWVRVQVGSRQVRALTFVVNRGHPRYAGRLDELEVARVVRQAVGFLGPCEQYVLETHQALMAMGIRDSHLQRVLGHLQILAGKVVPP